jgi:transcriptional regulator with XRE-family HTH domain
MFTVELYARIRRAVMADGLSRREAAKRFGVHRNTISKMLQFSVPPGYRRRERPASKKLGLFIAWIDTRHARRWRWMALRRPLAGEMVQVL